MSEAGYSGGSRRAKALLFCGVCGHESPADGDWDESTTTGEADERLVLSCPDCGATVTRRRLPETAATSAVVADD